jgi:anthranilate phosphoribosyltransferase
MIQHSISKLTNKQNLSVQEIRAEMKDILDGKISDGDIAQFLELLSVKGETNEELLGMLNEMQEFGVHISPKNKGRIIDVCGTGGDNLKTFNISTTASFVIAAAGGNVAKHGNRSVSGVSGSADIFEYFGYDLNAPAERITEIIEKCKIGFMFAPKFHPAMKNVAAARKIVNARTAFNLLGPLSNPADVKNQMIGVFSEEYLERLPIILKQKGSENIMTVRSGDGLDELSTTSKNKICLLKNDQIETFMLDPQELGLKKANLKEIQILEKIDSVKAFFNVLNGTASKSMIEITALNAAGGLIIAGIADNFTDAIEISLNTIKSGKSKTMLKDFVKECGNMQTLEEIKQL